MLSGIGFTASYIIWFKYVDPGAGADAWWWGISPEGIGSVGMLLNFTVALVVSRFSEPPPESVRALVEEIRLPRHAE